MKNLVKSEDTEVTASKTKKTKKMLAKKLKKGIKGDQQPSAAPTKTLMKKRLLEEEPGISTPTKKQKTGVPPTASGTANDSVYARACKVVFTCDVKQILFEVIKKHYPKLVSINFIAGKVGYCFGEFASDAEVQEAIKKGDITLENSKHLKAESVKNPHETNPTAFIGFTKMAFLTEVVSRALPAKSGFQAIQGVTANGLLVKFDTPEHAAAIKAKGQLQVLNSIPLIPGERDLSDFDKKNAKANKQQHQQQKQPQQRVVAAPLSSPLSGSDNAAGAFLPSDAATDDEQEQPKATGKPKMLKAKRFTKKKNAV